MFDNESFRASCVSRVSAGFSFTLTDGQKNSEEWNKRTWPRFAINKSSRKRHFIFFRKCSCQWGFSASIRASLHFTCLWNELLWVFKPSVIRLFDSLQIYFVLIWFTFPFFSFLVCSKLTSLSTSSNVWYLLYLWYLLSALFQGLMWCVSSLSRLF